MKNTFPKDIEDFFKKVDLNITEENLDYYDVENGLIYAASILKNNDIWITWIRVGDDYEISGSYIDDLYKYSKKTLDEISQISTNK